MKHLSNNAPRCNGKLFAQPRTGYILNFIVICLSAFIAFWATGCKKQDLLASTASGQQAIRAGNNSGIADIELRESYGDLEKQTLWELQQARAATAQYRHIKNAFKDGYQDINVIVPEMGYHYLRAQNLDEKFEFRKPEILVYNREEDGTMELVALEYAVPIELSPDAPPEGFTGDDDEWGIYQGQLWTLHAWIWKNNPEGVFKPTNPLVHLH